MTFHPSLQTVCDELLEEDVLLSQQTESADAVRTPSVSSDEPHSKGSSQSTVWWAKLIKDHSPPTRAGSEPERPLTVLSACTGAAAEIGMFKARVSLGT